MGRTERNVNTYSIDLPRHVARLFEGSELAVAIQLIESSAANPFLQVGVNAQQVKLEYLNNR